MSPWIKQGFLCFLQTFDGRTVRLVIREICVGEAGKYEVVVRNQYGKAKTSCRVYVQGKTSCRGS